MKKLKWKKTVRKAPRWLSTWKKNNDRVEWNTSNTKHGGFLIDLQWKGFTLFTHGRTKGKNKRIGTFYDIKKAQRVAQLIHNG